MIVVAVVFTADIGRVLLVAFTKQVCNSVFLVFCVHIDISKANSEE